MNDNLLPAELERRLVPSLVADDEYYPENEYSKQKELAIKDQIIQLNGELEPWQSEVARRTAYGETPNALSKTLKKSHKLIVGCLNMHTTQQVIALWQAVIVYQQGPNEAQRKNMLWRIAIDNEKADPKEATKAINAINAMEDNKRGIGNNKIEIVINNETMPRTALDG